MAKIIPTDKARQGHWGRHVLVILVVALLLTAIVWVAVGIFGEADDSDAPRATSAVTAPSETQAKPVYFVAA